MGTFRKAWTLHRSTARSSSTTDSITSHQRSEERIGTCTYQNGKRMAAAGPWRPANTAAGLRYVLFMFLTDLKDPSRSYRETGPVISWLPSAMNAIGDVSNVVFSNGWVARPDGKVFIYYASSDTRIACSCLFRGTNCWITSCIHRRDGLRSGRKRSASAFQLIKRNIDAAKK